MQQIPELVQELNLRGTTNAVCVATVKFTLDQLDGTFDANHPAPGKLAPQIEDLRTSYGAMNTAYAEQMKRSETAEIAALDQEGDHSGAIIDVIGDETATPLEQIVEEEDAEKLEGYIAGLPDLYRTIARMRLMDGLQYKEIAEELGMELNTIRTRIRRAKSMIEAMKAGEE